MSNALQVQQPQTPGNYSGSNDVFEIPQTAYQNETPVTPDQLRGSVEVKAGNRSRFDAEYLTGLADRAIDSSDARTVAVQDLGRTTVDGPETSHVESPVEVAARVQARSGQIMQLRQAEVSQEMQEQLARGNYGLAA